jgi:CubicO group peptidase (beta-lactamase class C family)
VRIIWKKPPSWSSPSRPGGSSLLIPIIACVWVEFLIALVVEGYRELREWWQTRALWRRPGNAPGAFEERALANEARVAVLARHRSSEVEDRVAAILGRHARKHVGVRVGVWWEGQTWTFARGRIGADRPEPPHRNTIFEIGSITKVFTATVLADLVEDGLVALDDPVQQYLPDGVLLPVRGRPITLADLAAQTSRLPRLPKGLVRLSLRQRRNPYAHFTAAHLQRAIVKTKLKDKPARRSATPTSGSACSATYSLSA